MNLKKLFRIKLAAMLLAIFVGTFVMSEVADAAYPPGPTYSYGCMALRYWRIYDDQNTILLNSAITISNCNHRPYNNPVTLIGGAELEAGREYRYEIYGNCYMGTSCGYTPWFRVWIDWNGDEDFSDVGEEILNRNMAPGNWYAPQYYTGYFTVPSSAEGNTCRMRVANRWNNYGSPPANGVGAVTGYGDYGDCEFSVPQPASDAGVTVISQPAGVMTLGTQNIGATIRNYAEGDLSSLSIIWRIDQDEGWYNPSTMSKTFTWTGSLAQDEEEEVIVGTWLFDEFRKYTIDAFCEMPNGKPDSDPSNDAALQRIVGPSLNATTYYIGAYGGSSNTFPTIEDATAYLSGAGVGAGGTLTFEFPVADPGPAVYEGPINIGTYPVPPGAEVNIVIKSASGDPEDVIIEFEPDGTTPYLASLNSANNLTIEGLTFYTGDAATDGWGGIIDLQSCNVVSITNNIFENVAGSDADNRHTSINLGSSYDVTIDGNYFYDGAISINESSYCPRKMQVTNNYFFDATWKFMQLYGSPDGSPCSENEVLINLNVFTGNETPNGILSTNGTEITNNNFTGFTGDGSSDAVVYVSNNDPLNFTGQTTILNNTMTGSLNDINGIVAQGVPNVRIEGNEIAITDEAFVSQATNGIRITGSGNSTTPVDIVDNEITIDGAFDNNALLADNSNVNVNYCDIDLIGGGGTVYSVYTTNNSTGYIANSQIGATNNTYAMYLNNSDMGVFYNAIVNESGTNPALIINSGTNTIMRNLIQNMLAGPAIVA
ncbi:GEVED domain-containing protein, partial [Bacteroidota bacterium]